MTDTLKETAKAFLQGIVTDRVREVYDRYTQPDFRHHNGYFRGDRQSLFEAMAEDNKNYPNKQVTIRLAIAEPPYVTLLAQVRITDEKEIAVVHVYRFEGDKIAEMWDISQSVPRNSPNENGMF